MSGSPRGETQLDQQGREIADTARDLYARGWMPGTSGNLSVRAATPERIFLVTASGRDKGRLGPRDVVAIDIATGETAVPTELHPSAETSIHTALYRETDARAVIHVHPPYSTAVAWRLGRPDHTVLLRLDRFELLKGLGVANPAGTDLPLFPNWPEVPRIAADAVAYLGRTPDAPAVFLISDHGITAWGRDLAQARDRLECVEAICEVLTITGAMPVARDDDAAREPTHLRDRTEVRHDPASSNA